MIQLVRGSVDPKWIEIRQGKEVLQEIEVHFKLWKIPKSFENVDAALTWLDETENKQARNRAYRLLSARSYPSTVLRKKLQECGYSDRVCSLVLKKLDEQGLLQDEEFWASFVRSEFRKGNGPRLIELKGKVKGMPPHYVRAHIDEEMQRAQIKKLEKKGFQSLMRKGFDVQLLVEFFRQ
jgi:SOS response regulatory protein OraA/RecX